MTFFLANKLTRHILSSYIFPLKLALLKLVYLEICLNQDKILLVRTKRKNNSTDAHNIPNRLAGYIYQSLLPRSTFRVCFYNGKQPLANTDPLLLSSVVYVISGLSLIPVAKASSLASPSSSPSSSLFSGRYIKRKNLLYLFIVSILAF